MKNEPTSRQQDVLDAVARAIRGRRTAPTILELAEELGVSGPTVHPHQQALVQKEFLRRKPGSPRGIELIGAVEPAPACNCVRVPIVGEVAGGAPIFAFEQPFGHVSVNRRPVAGEVLFALRVRGDSMTGSGILDGDLVVARRQQTAADGDIVVALDA